MKKYISIFFLFPILVHAQFNEYEPDYEWLTIKGEHVYVHYHPEAERTARTVLKIAEEVWEPITSLYEYEPEPVHFVIKDMMIIPMGLHISLTIKLKYGLRLSILI